jgi:hypothetical protein
LKPYESNFEESTSPRISKPRKKSVSDEEKAILLQEAKQRDYNMNSFTLLISKRQCTESAASISIVKTKPVIT